MPDTTSEPVAIVAVWLSRTYLYLRDANGQRYALARDDWKFPYLASMARADLTKTVRIESADLWEDCRELRGIALVKKESAA